MTSDWLILSVRVECPKCNEDLHLFGDELMVTQRSTGLGFGIDWEPVIETVKTQKCPKCGEWMGEFVFKE